MNPAVVQSQLIEHGLGDFRVARVSPTRSNIRKFFTARLERSHARHEVTPVMMMVSAALDRLANVPPKESVYRWEAESELGKIVGYSTNTSFIGVFPWIITTNDTWIASVIRF